MEFKNFKLVNCEIFKLGQVGEGMLNKIVFVYLLAKLINKFLNEE